MQPPGQVPAASQRHLGQPGSRGSTAVLVLPSGITQSGSIANSRCSPVTSSTSAGSVITNRNAARPDEPSACSASGLIRCRSGAPPPNRASLGETTNRSVAATRSGCGTIVPFVSISTRRPSAASCPTSGTRLSCCSSGSPPVITTSWVVDAHTHLASSSTLNRLLSAAGLNRVQSQVYGTSQPGQARLHRDSRSTSAGRPAEGPSPWKVGP